MRRVDEKRLIFKQLVLVVFSLGLIGLVFSTGNLQLIGYEVGKTIWLQWWVRMLALCLWGLVLLQSQDFNFKLFSQKNNLFLLLLIVVVVLTSVLGVNWPQSLWGNYYRGDGLITWFHLVAIGFLARWMLSTKNAQSIISPSLVMATLVLIVSVIFSESAAWLRIGFGNANITAGFLVVSTPLVIFGFRKLHRIFGVAISLLIFAITIYLQAWGAVISLLLGLVMWVLLGSDQLKKWVVVVPATVLVVGVWGLMQLQPVGNSQFTESRLRIFHKLGGAVKQRPILGWGWANVDTAFKSVDWPVPVSDDAYVDKAHSELLEIAVVSGLLGLGAYLLFLSGAYIEVVRSLKTDDGWRKTLLLTCLIFFFHSQTNVVSVAESAVFWISLGLLLD